ncbi:MAG TPA: hypothetical protein VE972_12320 [Conexibacter sp.]|nr:hypothetical protein [Conexibacter sp.]
MLTAFMGAGGSAVAETLNFSPAGRITLAGSLTWTDGLGARTTCAISLIGTLQRSVVTTREAEMGSISSATSERCEGGRITTLVPPPIPIVFAAVLRTAEVLVGILAGLRGIGILVEGPISECLYATTLGLLIDVRRNNTASVTLLRGAWELVRTLRGFCSVGNLAGTMELRPTQEVVLR